MHIVPQNTGDTACSSFIASYGVWHQWNLVCSYRTALYIALFTMFLSSG